MTLNTFLLIIKQATEYQGQVMVYRFRSRSCTSRRGEKQEEALFVEYRAAYLDIIYPTVSQNVFCLNLFGIITLTEASCAAAEV